MLITGTFCIENSKNEEISFEEEQNDDLEDEIVVPRLHSFTQSINISYLKTMISGKTENIDELEKAFKEFEKWEQTFVQY